MCESGYRICNFGLKMDIFYLLVHLNGLSFLSLRVKMRTFKFLGLKIW